MKQVKREIGNSDMKNTDPFHSNNRSPDDNLLEFCLLEFGMTSRFQMTQHEEHLKVLDDRTDTGIVARSFKWCSIVTRYMYKSCLWIVCTFKS